MNKRLISLLLVIVLICTLLPLSVMAEDSEPAPSSSVENIMKAVKELLITDNRTKVTPAKPSGETGMVVVPVFGKELTDILEEGKLFDHTKEALQVRLSDKPVIPEVKITITGTEDKTKGVQQEELELAKYSVFNDIIAHVGVKVQGRKAFKEVLTALKNHFLENAHSELGRKAVKGFFDAFNIPYEDDDIAAIVDNPSAFETNILNVIGRGEYTDVNGIVHVFNKEILGFKFGFTGLGLTEAECADVDSFFTALYSNYAGATVDSMITNAIQSIANDQLADYAGFAYQVYVKENLPAGDYQVKVEIIDRQGFTTFSKDGAKLVREYPVTVNAAEISYAGETRSEGTTTIDFAKLFAIEDDGISQIESDSDNSIIKLFNFVVEAKDKLNELYNAVIGLAPNNKEITLPIIGKVALPLVVDFTLDFTGVWLDRQEPYIGFANEDLGGNSIKKTVADDKAQFVMVDRDELLNVMEAMIGVGKDVFTNTVNGLKEVYKDENPDDNLPTWDEFTAMHKDILSLDTTGETPQVQFDAKSLLKVVWIYVKMMDIPSVWDNFLAKDVRLPAILMAMPDDNGVVKISEDSNVTLVWMLDALIKIADVSQEALADLGKQLRESGAIKDVIGAVFEGAELENPELEQLLVNVLTWIAENTDEGSEAVVTILKTTAEPVKGIINEWVYPLLQNDALFHLVGQFLEVKDGNGKMHGILTDKMPDSYYLLLQKKAPEGYLINPMIYTVKLDWAEDGWVYAKIANLGIVLPYFAEDYYTFLRNNSIAKTSDAILNRISNGKYETLIQDIISGKVNATEQVVTASATGIAFQSWIMYNFMGGRLVYKGEDGQTALQNDLVKWIKAKGNTAQNLLGFGNEIYQRSKAVVTADLTLTENEEPEDMWAFYNASKSIKENIVAQATAIMKGISGSIITDGSKVNGAVKNAIDRVIEGAAKIDTTSKLAAAVDQAKQKATETVTKAATSLITTAIKKTASLFSSLFKSLRS